MALLNFFKSLFSKNKKPTVNKMVSKKSSPLTNQRNQRNISSSDNTDPYPWYDAPVGKFNNDDVPVPFNGGGGNFGGGGSGGNWDSSPVTPAYHSCVDSSPSSSSVDSSSSCSGGD